MSSSYKRLRSLLLVCGAVALGIGWVQASGSDRAHERYQGGWSAIRASMPQRSPQAASRATADGMDADRARGVLDRYCVTCHNARLKTGNLALDQADIHTIGSATELWEKVVLKLESREMPPGRSPRPDDATCRAVASWLVGELDGEAAAHPNPGRTGVHRLNRAEYSNAVRDLLAVEVDTRTLLPPDDSSYGFDNIADVLRVSGPLMDRYLSAAQKISRIAVGDATIRPVEETYSTSNNFRQDSRMGEDVPFGTRGGIAVHHNFSVDGEYTIRVRLARSILSGMIKGLEIAAVRYEEGQPRKPAETPAHEIDVLLDGRRVQALTIGGPVRNADTSTPSTSATAPGSQSVAPPPARLDRVEDQERDSGLIVRVPVNAGRHVVAVTFPDESAVPEGFESPLPTRSFSFNNTGGPVAVGTLTIGGPYNVRGSGSAASRQRIFVCEPKAEADDDRCSRTILSRLARRGYRRPVTDDDIKPLVETYRNRRSEGGDFEAGIQASIEAILMSPDFLFRLERDPAAVSTGAIHRIRDVELASRLSFFLWSSIPDDELLAVAERDELHAPNVLAQQLRRMVDDRRSQALVENFFSQWLYLRNLDQLQPDATEFPAFDDELRAAFRQETELFVGSQLHEDHSVVDLLQAPYTFVNERLARFYGIPNVSGSHFRRVNLPDERRAGLLGQGSILAATSYANRTSPVLRGKFVLKEILGAPPPPPPPNVPAFDEGTSGPPRSTRERLEQHRKNPACAACHAKIDPLGFALENFDPIGQWRDKESGLPIDATGTTSDGTSFNGPAELRRALLARKELFLMNVTQKLLTYALGRGLESYDQPAVRKIMRDAAQNDYRWSAFIAGTIQSAPFQMRRAE